MTSRPERCAFFRKSAMGICCNITPPNPFTHGDKDFHPPYCKCCPSVRGIPLTCFRGPALHRNVSIHIHITVLQYGGFRLRVHITTGSPNVHKRLSLNLKGTQITLHANIAAGRDRSHIPRITRKASWPLAQRGVLFLVNLPLVFVVSEPSFLLSKISTYAHLLCPVNERPSNFIAFVFQPIFHHVCDSA